MVLRFLLLTGFVWSIVQSTVRSTYLLIAFVAGMTINALFGLWQFAAQAVPGTVLFGVSHQAAEIPGVSVVVSGIGRFLRSYGTLPHPNIFGGYLALACIALVGVALKQANKKTRWSDLLSNMWIMSLLVLFFALLFSFSRSAWLGVAVGGVVLLFATIRFGYKRQYEVWIRVALVGLIGLIAAASFFFPLFKERIQLQEQHEVVSLEDRKQGYNDASVLIKKYWWRGVGLTRFTYAVVDEVDPNRNWWELHPVHNVYALLAVEASAFSALVWIGIMVMLVSRLKNAFSLRGKPFPTAIIGIAMLSALLMIGFFDSYIVSLPSGLLLLFFAIAIIIKGEEELSEQGKQTS